MMSDEDSFIAQLQNPMPDDTCGSSASVPAHKPMFPGWL